MKEPTTTTAYRLQGFREARDRQIKIEKEGWKGREGERKSLKAAVTRLHKANQLLRCKHSRRRMDQSGEILKAHPVTCVLGEEGRTNCVYEDGSH